MRDRRSFLKSVLTLAAIPAAPIFGNDGVALKRFGGKYVLVFDPARMTIASVQSAGMSLGVPIGTRIVAVRCNEGQKPEDAFQLLEVKQ